MMADPNEAVVRLFLEDEGFFGGSSVRYSRSKKRTGLKSGGWGGIDLLARHHDRRRCLIEVKGWHDENLVPYYFEKRYPYVDKAERDEVGKAFRKRRFKTVLVGLESRRSRARRFFGAPSERE